MQQFFKFVVYLFNVRFTFPEQLFKHLLNKFLNKRKIYVRKRKIVNFEYKLSDAH